MWPLSGQMTAPPRARRAPAAEHGPDRLRRIDPYRPCAPSWHASPARGGPYRPRLGPPSSTTGAPRNPATRQGWARTRDMRDRGLAELDLVDITRVVEDGNRRNVYGVRAMPCDVPAGCAALPPQRLAAPAAAAAASVY